MSATRLNGATRRTLPSVLSAADAIECARSLQAGFAARVAETDANRSLPRETVRELLESGLFGIATPRAWGGSELPPEVWVRVIAEIAAGCGSTAWVYGVLLGHMWLVGQFPQEAQAEVFSDSYALVASLVRLGGTTPERADGGYRWRNASGRFCSGIDHSSWVVVGGTVSAIGPEISDADTAGESAKAGEDGKSQASIVLKPASPGKFGEARWFLIPRADIEIEDDWFTVGLRGTGSKSIKVADAFVAEYRSIPMAGLPQSQHEPRAPLFRLPMSTFAFPLSASSVGIAGHAVSVVGERLQKRLGKLDPASLAEHSSTLVRFGEVASNVEFAYDLLQHRARRLMATADEPYSPLERVQHRRDVAFAARQAREATNTLMLLTGGSGLYDSAEVERLWRDCTAAAAHASLSWDGAAAGFARAQLGLPPSTTDPFAR